MEKDFHYYLIYSLAKTSGYDKADIIAYSSQFVDDNNEGLFSIDGENATFPEKIRLKSGGYYYPIMTQSLSPKSLNPYVQKYVYTPFHFLPGDNNVEIKGKKNSFNTTPNSANASALLKVALKSGNPFRIGIALHTFADTWSHQNFTGCCEDWNSVYPWYNVFKSIAPNIGHAETGHAPDVISDIWTDYRLGKRIYNQERAFEATEEIYKALTKNSGNGRKWNVVKKSYRSIIEASGYDDRIAKIKDFLIDNKMGPVPKYLEHKWIDNALDRREYKIVMASNFTKTHWYKFHQAAKAHFAHVADLTKNL